MRKLIYVILYILLLMPIAFAEVKVNTVKVYKNDARYSSADRDGGDIKVNRDDTLMFTVDLDNDLNETAHVRLKGTIDNIDNGDDLKEEQSDYEISPLDSRAKSISFVIPTDAIIDEYDMELRIDYYYNDSSTVIRIDYTIIVQDAVLEPISDREVLTNLSATCSSLINTMGTCFNYVEQYQTCADEKSTLQNDVGTYKTSSEDCNSLLSTCNNDRVSAEAAKSNCETKLTTMKTSDDCQRETAAAVLAEQQRGSKQMQSFFIIGAIGALVIWLVSQQKKAKLSQPTSWQYQQGRIR